MSHITDPATHWRARAQEKRSIANAMPGLPRAQDALLGIAEQYELNAARAEGKEKGASAVEHDDDTAQASTRPADDTRQHARAGDVRS